MRVSLPLQAVAAAWRRQSPLCSAALAVRIGSGQIPGAAGFDSCSVKEHFVLPWMNNTTSRILCQEKIRLNCD